MKKTHKAIWAWLRRDQTPTTIEQVLADAEIDQEKFFDAARQLRHVIEKAGRRKALHPDKDLQLVHDLRLARVKKAKAAKKAKKLKNLERQYFAIKQWREKGASWADVLTLLRRHHQLQISASYLHKIWPQLVAKYEGGSDANE